MAKLTEQQLKEWLESDRYSLSIDGKTDKLILYKSSINEDFILLYCKRVDKDDSFGLTSDLLNSGIYYRKDGCIYNPGLNIKILCEDLPLIKANSSKTGFIEQLNSAVKEYVQRIINYNSNNYSSGEISDEFELGNLRYFINHTAKERARALFLSEKNASDVLYEYKGNFGSFTNNNYLEFITNKDWLVKSKGDKYIEENRENILLQLKENEAIKEELQGIYDNPDHELYRIKEIIRAVKKSGAKTVNVTINKNNKEFTFKYNAALLQNDPKGYYHNWGMKTTDEIDFERYFGKEAKFSANDITQISYCRNVIYDSSEFEVAESEDNAIIQSM